MVNASNSQFLYCRVGNPELVWLFVVREHPNDGDERMREFRVISAVLIRKRNYKITLVRKGTSPRRGAILALIRSTICVYSGTS